MLVCWNNQIFSPLDAILEAHLPQEELQAVRQLLYGKAVKDLPVAEQAAKLAEAHDFEIKAFKFDSAPEHTRAPRIVRVGAIQNAVVLPTTDPVQNQVLLL